MRLHNPQNCPKMGKIPCFLPDKQGTLHTRSKMHPQSLLRARPFTKRNCLTAVPFLFGRRSRQTALPASGGKAINRGYLLYCVFPILTAPARQKSAGNTVVLINFFNKAGVAKWANPEGRLIFVYNRLFLSAGGTTTRLKKKAPSKLKIKTAQRQTAPVACLGPERCFCLRAEKGALSRKAKTARTGPKDFYVSKNTAGESRRPDHLESRF